MLKFIKKHLFWCIMAPLFMLGEIYAELVQPSMMATIIDKGVLSSDIPLIQAVGIKMLGVVAIGVISGIAAGIFAQTASQKFANDLRKALFGRIVDLSFEQTDRLTTGSLITRLSNDVTQVQAMVGMSVRAIGRVICMFGGGLFMLYRQSPTFFYAVACSLPLMVIFVCFFLKKASPMFSIVQGKLDTVNNVMHENVIGNRVVKAFVREDYEQGRFEDANNELFSINIKVQSLLAFMRPLMNIILNLCVVAVIAIGGWEMQKNPDSIGPGQIMASITYVTMILHSVTFMANIFQTFTRAKASSMRINEVLNTDCTIKSGAFSEETPLKGEIELKNVSFAYPGSGGEEVLKDISFKLHRGQTLGILGSTGCGKTTLTNLLPRFYDASSGEVIVDGVNVKDYDLTTLRAKIAIVMQKAELYSRSVCDNISWGRPESTPWEIKSAAETAQADSFICAKSEGYYTLVTEGGHSLSGGQKQRLSIARAVLKNAEILIFDDSTSALDLKTEAKLYKALYKRCPDTTKIIIAQRIASVKDADMIAVIENGRISAMADHATLMKTSAVYRDIYDSQMKQGASFGDE